MGHLGKIHFVKNNAHVTAWKISSGKHVPAFNFVNKEETYCGKIMEMKFITSDLRKTTCNECLNKLKTIQNEHINNRS